MSLLLKLHDEHLQMVLELARADQRLLPFCSAEVQQQVCMFT